MNPARCLRFLLFVLPFVGYSLKEPSQFVVTDTDAQEDITSFGFAVTFADPCESVTVAAGKGSIVIFSGVSANDIEGKYKTLPIPTVTWAPRGVDSDEGVFGAFT